MLLSYLLIIIFGIVTVVFNEGENLVSCKNLYSNLLYMYIYNKICSNQITCTCISFSLSYPHPIPLPFQIPKNTLVNQRKTKQFMIVLNEGALCLFNF